MSRIRSTVGLFCGILSILAAAPLTAQSADGEAQRFSISQARQLPSAGVSVRAYLDVQNAGGEPIAELPTNRLSATLGSFPTTVRAAHPFDRLDEGVATLFLVDVSGSVRLNEFQEIRAAIDAWVARMEGADRVALISFGSESRLLVDWTGQFDQVRTALNKLSPTDDFTLLYQGVSDALELGRRKDVDLPGRRVVIVLSDGRDEGSKVAFEDILASVRDDPTPIYTIGFAPAGRANRQRDMDVLRRLAGNSGGAFFEVSATNLTEAYQEIRRAVGAVWAVDLLCDRCAADGEQYRLQIDLETTGRVLSSGAQVRLLPQPRSSAPGEEASSTLPVSPTEERVDDGVAPQVEQRESVVPGRLVEASWLFSTKSLLMFWLPLLLGLALVVAGFVRSRSESNVLAAPEPMLAPISQSERPLGADQLYSNKEDEPAVAHSTPQGGTRRDGSSSSFSLSLPQVEVAQEEVVGSPLNAPRTADPEFYAGLASDSESDSVGSMGEEELSPLPSLRASDGKVPSVKDRALPLQKDVVDVPRGRALYTVAPRVIRFAVLRGNSKGKQYRALLRQRLVVGSRSTADLVILNEPNVAAEQFELEQEGGDILIRSLDEDRPILINGIELEERQVLQPGDLVGNGDIILRTMLGD